MGLILNFWTLGFIIYIIEFIVEITAVLENNHDCVRVGTRSCIIWIIDKK